MPWNVSKTDQCPAGKPWGVIKEDDGKLQGCHESKTQAEAQQAALYAAENAERGVMARFKDFVARLRGLLAEAEAEEPEQERGLSLSQIGEQFWLGLQESEEHREGWPVDFYLDGADMYALVAERGKMYRVPVVVGDGGLVAGDWQEVETFHQPVGRTLVSRQADGRYRWLNISATATLNRVAEIDSRALFDSFITYARESGEYPERDFFHLGEPAAIGRADLLERDDAVLISSGLFYDTPLAQAVARAIQAEPGEWGDSISYRPMAEPDLLEVAEGVRVPVYSRGRLHYISTLPENRAASLFTTATVGEVTRMRQEIKDALLRLTAHGLKEDEIETIIGAVDETNRAIQDDGLVNREDGAEAPCNCEDGECDCAEEGAGEPEAATGGEDAPPDEEAEPEPVERLVELDAEALAAIVAQVLADPALAGLQEQMRSLAGQVDGLQAEVERMRADGIKRSTDQENRLVALERDDETKQRQWQADLPARATSTTRVTYRPRDAKAEEGADAPPDLASVAQRTLAAYK